MDSSRRNFLSATGAFVAGSALSACGGNDTANNSKLPATWDATADVIVIGLGGAGAAAALTASSGGAKGVLIIEKMDTPGGSSSMAAGAFAAANSSLQQALGVTDTPQKMYDFLDKLGMGTTVPEVLKAYCDNSAASFAWLTGIFTKQTGETDVKKLWGSLSFTGSSYVTAADVVPRFSIFAGNTAAGLPKGGAGEFAACYGEIQKDSNITVKLSTPASSLIVNDSGVVVGVASISGTKTSNFKANKAVVITTGDFSRNDAMAKQLAPFVYYAFKITAVGDTGEGILLGQAVGADLSGVGGDMSHPRTTEPPPGAVTLSGGSLATNGVPGAANGEFSNNSMIFVNNSGQRFVNESTMSVPASKLNTASIPASWTSYYAGFQIFNQDKMQAWAIFDDQVASKGGNKIVSYWSADLSTEIAGGYVVKADTIAALAAAIGVNATALANTISLWNTDAAKSADTLYGRPNNFMQINTGPYYAAPLNWTCDQSFGGLKINGKTQVLDTNGAPIPHLYSAGSSTGGIMGRFYQSSGVAIGSAYTMGMLAGQNGITETPA